jgi:hypothetical protein
LISSVRLRKIESPFDAHRVCSTATAMISAHRSRRVVR